MQNAVLRYGKKVIIGLLNLFLAVASVQTATLTYCLCDNFTDVMTDLYEYVNPKNGKHSPLISKEIYEIIMANADVSGTYFTWPLGDPGKNCCLGYHLRSQANGGTQGRGISFFQYRPN